MTVTRRKALTSFGIGAAAAVSGLRTVPRAAAQSAGGGILRVALSNQVINNPTGNSGFGVEGRRFIDQTLFDPLMYQGTQQAGHPDELQPLLATSFTSDPNNRRIWVIELRQGVKFHDGSDFNADSLVWNLEKLFKRDAPQFLPAESGSAMVTAPTVGWEKRGPFTVAIETDGLRPFMPFSLGRFTMASPARFAQVGNSWQNFAQNPSGTGPFRFVSVNFQARLEMTRNSTYWDAARIPRAEGMVCVPMFEPNTRTNALLAGQVNWIEAVAPDTVGIIRSRGARLVTNPYPQVWFYKFDRRETSPFHDIRVRQAMNLALDRDGLTRALNGLMSPAVGFYPKDHKWFGRPALDIRFDPQRARTLLAEAGYGPNRPIRGRVISFGGGTGMMQPPIMNAFIQGQLAPFGFQFDVIYADPSTMAAAEARGVGAAESQGATMMMNSRATHDPAFLEPRIGAEKFSPIGQNWGFGRSAAIEAALTRVNQTFDAGDLDKAYADLHAALVDDAFFLFVAHDAFPRAFAANVRGFAEGYNGIRVQDPSFISVT